MRKTKPFTFMLYTFGVRFLNFYAEIFESASGHNVHNTLQSYVLKESVARTIRLDQARCQIAQIQALCKHNNLELNAASLHDHRTNELM